MLAPDWLTKPANVNDLAKGIWPANAKRESEGQLSIGGVSVGDLAGDYGTLVSSPLSKILYLTLFLVIIGPSIAKVRRKIKAKKQ